MVGRWEAGPFWRKLLAISGRSVNKTVSSGHDIPTGKIISNIMTYFVYFFCDRYEMTVKTRPRFEPQRKLSVTTLILCFVNFLHLFSVWLLLWQLWSPVGLSQHFMLLGRNLHKCSDTHLPLCLKTLQVSRLYHSSSGISWEVWGIITSL